MKTIDTLEIAALHRASWLGVASALSLCLSGAAHAYPHPPASMIGSGSLDECSQASIPGAHSLERVDLVAATGDPKAVCLDGTHAMMYVAPGSNGDEDKWVIVFEGGGSGYYRGVGVGTAADELAEGLWGRYSGDDGALLSNRWKNSTDWGDGVNLVRDGNPDVAPYLDCGGILGVSSPFATWTRVFINYCSSDLWAGDGYIDVPAGTWATMPRPAARFELRGRRVVARTLQMLHQQGTGGSFFADQGGVFSQDIDDATDVLLAGESAGATGVLNNADFVAGGLSGATNVRYSQGAHALPMAPVCALDPWLTDRDADGIDDHVSGDTQKIEQMQAISCNGSSPCYYLDESCETSMGSQPEDLIACLSTFEVLAAGELDRPVFVKQDLSDHHIGGSYSCSGCGYSSELACVGLNPNADVTIDDFAVGVSAGIDQRIAESWTSGGVGVSYFAPDCGAHETLAGPKFFTNEIEYGITSYRYSYASALEDFMDGYSVTAEAGDGNWKAGCF